jgi:hypothetical protein
MLIPVINISLCQFLIPDYQQILSIFFFRSFSKIKANVKYFRYYPIRHLGASTLDRANVNIGSIQRILGHENRTTTEIYLHSIGEAERKAMQIFENFEKSHMNSHTDEKEVTDINLQPLNFHGGPGQN